MRVLIVCSRRYYAPYTDYIAPFIYEQVNSLKNLGVEFDFFRIDGGGIKSYIKAVPSIRKKIKEFQPDIIHAHYGLCGVVANTQRKIPVITTYHGSDINWSLKVSNIAIKLSKWNIFVSDRLYSVAGRPDKSSVIPCGFNVEAFNLLDKNTCRQQLGWDLSKKIILFSKEFSDKAKNYPLAKAAIDSIGRDDIDFLELFGYSREQMPLVLNACDLLLMTSLTEGSPQVIKEAVACGCPIVSTDVGDVKEVIEGVPNTYLVSYDEKDVAEKILLSINTTSRTNSGKKRIIERYDNAIVCKRIKEIYDKIA